jgi:hypothetical protein
VHAGVAWDCAFARSITGSIIGGSELRMIKQLRGCGSAFVGRHGWAHRHDGRFVRAPGPQVRFGAMIRGTFADSSPTSGAAKDHRVLATPPRTSRAAG